MSRKNQAHRDQNVAVAIPAATSRPPAKPALSVITDFYPRKDHAMPRATPDTAPASRTTSPIQPSRITRSRLAITESPPASPLPSPTRHHGTANLPVYINTHSDIGSLSAIPSPIGSSVPPRRLKALRLLNQLNKPTSRMTMELIASYYTSHPLYSSHVNNPLLDSYNKESIQAIIKGEKWSEPLKALLERIRASSADSDPSISMMAHSSKDSSSEEVIG